MQRRLLGVVGLRFDRLDRRRGDFCDFDFGFDDASGVYTSAGSIDLGGVNYGLEPTHDSPSVPKAQEDASGATTSMRSSEPQDVLSTPASTISDSFDDTGVDGQFLQGVFAINKVPEPTTMWLLGMSLMGFAALRRQAI